jgi:ribosomal protein L7/L12
MYLRAQYVLTVTSVIVGVRISQSIWPNKELPRIPASSLRFYDTAFTVILRDGGANKIATIKAIRGVTRLGLEDAKVLVDSTPTAIAGTATREEAVAIARRLEGVAEVEIVSSVRWRTYESD